MRSRPPIPPSPRRLYSERGSMLLTAVVFAAGSALVLGSYLALSRTSLKVAHRTFFANDAANLAEAGAEEALYCFNQMTAGSTPATAWSGWTFSGANAMRTLTPLNRDQNAVGVIKVYVKGYDSSDAAPYVISQATITPFDGGAPIVRSLRLTVQRTGNLSANGLVALNGLTLSGTSTADSFNSNPANSPTGPWLAYSSAIAQSNTVVVVLAGSISVGSNSKIFGSLKLGAGVTAPAASKYTGTLTTNYSAAFPLPTYPTTSSVSQSYNVGSSIPTTLPVSGHLPASDGRYYYFCSNTTIGAVTISTGKNVTIVGTSTGMGSGINIQSNATCQIYMDGAVTLSSGNDINNVSWTGALRIYTSTAANCTVGNKSQLVGCLHAPNALLKLSGTDASNMVVGYYVAKTITASGSMDFHYDESLGATTSAASYSVTQWLDLNSSADRALVAGLTNNYLR